MAGLSASDMARIHAAAFPDSRGWNADEFADLAQSEHVFFVFKPDGFAAGRVIVNEAELLTIAVHPSAQKQGLGRHILRDFETTAHARGATSAMLEVATDNSPARALYQQAGWSESGRRKDYYTRQAGKKIDALVLHKQLSAPDPLEK